MDGITSADLIRTASAEGYHVTVPQLERWRHGGLIPSVRQRGRGRSAGALWFHPPRAQDQLLELLRIRRPREPLAALAVRLWLRKWDVPLPKLRHHLAKGLSVFGRVRGKVRERGVAGFGEAFGEVLRRRRSARGKYGIGRLDEAGYDRGLAIGEAIAAQFEESPQPPTPQAAAAIEHAMSFTAAEMAVVKELGSTFRSEIVDAMPWVTGCDRAAAVASEEDLLMARDLWARVHALDEGASALPPDHPLRDFILRMTHGHDEPVGLGMLLLVIQRARSVGISDVVERVDIAFGIGHSEEALTT